MFLTRDDDFEEMTDNIIHTSPLQDISEELIMDCLDDQIKNPFSTKMDYLEDFARGYEKEEATGESNEDIDSENKNIARNFYLAVLEKIANKFDLGIDFDLVGALDIEALKTLVEGIYSFFIIEYSDNISQYLTKVILDFKETIVGKIEANREETDEGISVIGYNYKMKDNDAAILLGNIDFAVQAIKDIEMSDEDFIKIYNLDEFGPAVVAAAIKRFVITGDFISNFLNPVFGDEKGDMYDAILSNVQQYIFLKFKKDGVIEMIADEEEEA